MITVVYSAPFKPSGSNFIYDVPCVQCCENIRVLNYYSNKENKTIFCARCRIYFELGEILDVKQINGDVFVEHSLGRLTNILLSGKFSYSIEPDERIIELLDLPKDLGRIVAQYCMPSDKKCIVDFINVVDDIARMEVEANRLLFLGRTIHNDLTLSYWDSTNWQNELRTKYCNLLRKKERLMIENNIKNISDTDTFELRPSIDIGYLNLNILQL